jgi:hypothetical protein
MTIGRGPAAVLRRLRPPHWRRVVRSGKLWTLVLFLLLLGYGTWRFESLILDPPEQVYRPVALEDLSADRWYETDLARQLTRELGDMTERPAIRFATGAFYRLYKSTYSSGVLNTQMVRVGPDQYPAIYEMVTDACEILGSADGEPVPVPRVYIGYNAGHRGIKVTNYQSPNLVIGDAFLWAFKPSELRFLIARKIGSIHCRHVFLLDVVKGMRGIIDSALPEFVGRILLGGVGGRLLEWLKEAEITADRAGLLVVGDVDVATNALIKLNLQASLDDFYGPANPEAYARQIELLDDNRLTTASAALAELKNPNPFTTVRVADLLSFYEANSSLFMDRRPPSANPGAPADDAEIREELDRLWEESERSGAAASGGVRRLGGGGDDRDETELD